MEYLFTRNYQVQIIRNLKVKPQVSAIIVSPYQFDNLLKLHKKITWQISLNILETIELDHRDIQVVYY